MHWQRQCENSVPKKVDLDLSREALKQWLACQKRAKISVRIAQEEEKSHKLKTLETTLYQQVKRLF